MDIEKEIRITVSELPNRPNEEVYETMEDYGLLGGDVMIYRVGWLPADPLSGIKRKGVEVTCTACGETYYLEHANLNGCNTAWCPSTYGFIHPETNEIMYHGQNCLCPMCGAGCEAAHVSRFRYYNNLYIISSNLCLTVHNVDGHLAVLTWRVQRCANKFGQISYQAEKYEGVMIVGGKLIRLAGHQKNMGGADYELERWERRTRFDIKIDCFNTLEIMPFNKDEFDGTDSAHSALDVFLCQNLNDSTINVFQYLKLWCKYPNVENLVRSGFSGAVNSLIDFVKTKRGYYHDYTYTFDTRETQRLINWKETRPHKMLGIEKEDAPLLKKYSFSKVFLYNYAKRVDKVRLSREFLNSLNEHEAGVMVEFLQNNFHGFKPPFIKTRRYVGKQKQRCEQKGLIDYQYLKDYWNALYKVYGTLDKDLLYPKDLKVAHDRTIMLVKEKENEALSNKINKATEKYIDFTFEDKKAGLMITPCRSHNDLLKEGELLQHCVATYAQSVAAGRTCIFFIRKLSEPDIPYYTLELKEGRVIQNRGFKNCDRTPQVIAFEKKWLKFIEGVMENGKSNNSSAAT